MFCPNPDCPDAADTGVRTEYREGILACPVCGAGLVAFDAPAPVPAAQIDLVPCVTVGDVSLLPHIKAILAAADVPHFVKNEGVQDWIGWGAAGIGFNPITGPPVVMVEASRLDEATALLKEISSASEAREADPEDEDIEEEDSLP